MKFIRFKINNLEKFGVSLNDEKNVIDLEEALNKKFSSMIDLIKNITNSDLKTLEEILQNNSIKRYSVNDIKICSPIEKPIHDILCVGVNYKDHLKEVKDNFGEELNKKKETVFFSKRANKIIGPNDYVENDFNLDEDLDYEVELAVVIGKKGKNISKESVEEYIFGYSIFNDFSARGLQKRHIQWFRGKSLDTFSSMGPSIVHKSNFSFPIELDIKCFVNGELRQYSNTKYLIVTIDEIISEISRGITLEPGDIIITGTPSGVGLGFSPPKFLKKGDEVICEISKIGTLVNIIK